MSIDVNMMTMTPTEAAPGQSRSAIRLSIYMQCFLIFVSYNTGQYHRPSRLSSEWTYYADPSEAPKPRTNYGMQFYFL